MTENAGGTVGFVSARIDFAFRAMMREERVCRDFLCAALGLGGEDIRAADVVPIETLGASEAYRKGMLRYHLALADGGAMEALVVVTRQPCWVARAMGYACRMYAEQAERGAAAVVPVAIIGVRDAPDDAGARIHASYRMREDESGEAYSSLIQVHEIALPKRVPAVAASSPLAAWVAFLCAATRDEQRAAAGAYPALQEALRALDAIAEDAQSYASYRRRAASIEEFAEELRLAQQEGMQLGERNARERAEEAGRSEGRKEGRIQGYKDGLKEGRTETQRDIARSMLQHGADWQLIKDVTQLSHAQVDEIWQQMQGA